MPRRTWTIEEKQTHSHQVALDTDFGDLTISPGTVPATRSTIPQPAQPSKEAQAAFPHCPSHCLRGAEAVARQEYVLPSTPLPLPAP